MCYILRVNRHISYSHTFLHMALAFLTNIILTFPSCKIKYKLYWIKFFTTTPKLCSEINIVYCIVTISRNILTANHTKFLRLMPYTLINVIKTAVAKMSKKNGFISWDYLSCFLKVEFFKWSIKAVSDDFPGFP